MFYCYKMECGEVHKPTHTYTGLHIDMPTNTDLLIPTQAYTGLHIDLPTNTGLHRPTQ